MRLLTLLSLAVISITASDLEYSASGELKFPARYREWVFLGSGLGMTYGPVAEFNVGRPPMFDNVYVNPESYRAFLESGKWPAKTQFVLEIRNSERSGSINRGGNFQTDLVGIEMNVKDPSSPNGEWTFYNFPIQDGKPSAVAKAIPRSADCYQCHTEHTAVENTFVQFYPTLYEVAQHQGTVKPGFAPLPLNLTQLEALVRTAPWPQIEAALDKLASQTPQANSISLATLSVLGSRLTQAGKTATGVNLLEWSSRQYPGSALVQNDLADAYRIAGKLAAAKTATSRSLQLAESDPMLNAVLRKAVTDAAANRLKLLN
ncbi:cytochrome P460 family protein [Bryobacter aggregatus]|uniref:cytochrome P460 family protein n=1 Tax=Bryobacter aggregatus TaxID=360054 RepID=UPI0009B5BDE6|nr:cytochrome P460 family protein [Bryobacter aggregatus]